ncbi:MAG: FecR domain-containing protein [Bacteroidetes bacterium]|nr:FecR domain-containing protein [Bacteroidota bacterium]
MKVVVVLTAHGVAQQSIYTFRASELPRVAYTFLGDSSAIHLLLSVATHDVGTNTFTLSAQQKKILQWYAAIHKTVRDCKQRRVQAVKNGAKVFAPQLLDSLTRVFQQYDDAIRVGSPERLKEFASEIQTLTQELERRIELQRLEPVDARLAEKTGTVDKRKGFLGKWLPASKGDLFVAYDGVRTYEQSTALLVFTDGVDVTVDPNTTIIIRESSTDKLLKTKKKDIALVQGSVLARMDEKAKEENDLRLQADEAHSAVKSKRFWASVESKVRARLSNYDGTIDVAAKDVRVTLEQNQGTVVERGKPPAKPIPLLPAPDVGWYRSDTTVYSSTFTLSWNPVEGARKYSIEVAPTENFSRVLYRQWTTSPRFTLTQLPLGISYVRITAYDVHELRGIDSPVLTIVRVEDVQPPAIQFEGWESDVSFTSKTSITIQGVTESQATVVINGTAVSVNREGRFTYTTSVKRPETKLSVVAKDFSGNATTRVLTIVPIDTTVLFQLRWSCSVENGTLRTGGKGIEVYGIAYPTMRVRATYGTESRAVFTNARGEWALVLSPHSGDTLTLTFESLTDGIPVASRSWEVIR